jgi:hypothetical protein
MRSKLIANILMLVLFNLLIPVASRGQIAAKELPTDANFSLSPTAEDRTQFNLIIYDSDERTVSGLFSINQLKILQAIMFEAEKFALTQEAVGTDKPNTMRFYDKQEQAFIVDVQKLGNQSQFFFTLETEIGKITVHAGKINRSNKREEGFYFDLLTKVEAEIAKLARPSPK